MSRSRPSLPAQQSASHDRKKPRPSLPARPSYDRHNSSRSQQPANDDFYSTDPGHYEVNGNHGRHGQRDEVAEKASRRAREELKSIMSEIERSWDFMLPDKRVPVQTAMELLDEYSRLGLWNRRNEFDDIYTRLDRALRHFADLEHQAYNSTLGTFHGVGDRVMEERRNLAKLRADLELGKSRVTGPRANMGALARDVGDDGELLNLLDRIGHARTVPGQVESLMTAGRYVAAVGLLQKGLRTVRAQGFDRLDALSELRNTLTAQEASLSELLAEHLVRLVFPAYRIVQSGIPSDKFEDRGRTALNEFIGDISPDPSQDAAAAESANGLLKTDDMSQKNRFGAICHTVIALYNLGRLESAIRTVSMKTAGELGGAVSRTVERVANDHPAEFVSLTSSRYDPDPGLRQREIVLRDLFTAVFKQIDMIAEAHQALISVVHRLEDGHGMTEAGGLDGLTTAIKSELLTLTRDYIEKDWVRADSVVGTSGMPNPNRPLFNSSSEVTEASERVAAMFRVAGPSLAQQAGPTVPTTLVVSGKRFGQVDEPVSRPRLLVAARIFNLRTIVPLILPFFARLREVIRHDQVAMIQTGFNKLMTEHWVPLLGRSLDQETAGMLESNRTDKPGYFYNVVFEFCETVNKLDGLPGQEEAVNMVESRVTESYIRCVRWLEARTGSLASRLVDIARPDSADPTIETAETVKMLMDAIPIYESEVLAMRSVAKLSMFVRTIGTLGRKLSCGKDRAMSDLTDLAGQFIRLSERAERAVRAEVRAQAGYFLQSLNHDDVIMFATRLAELEREVSKMSSEPVGLAGPPALVGLVDVIDGFLAGLVNMDSDQSTVLDPEVTRSDLDQNSRTGRSGPIRIDRSKAREEVAILRPNLVSVLRRSIQMPLVDAALQS